MRRLAAVLSLAALTACGALSGAPPDGDAAAPAGPARPEYLGVETALLDDDLVRFRVAMRGARGVADLDRYARCAAARYALIRGYGFARHVRTLTEESAGIWRADAVYTVSPALPPGLRTIDAEVVAAECGQSGVPSV